MILESLARYPKTLHELAGDCKIAPATAARHLEYLKNLGKLTTADFKRKKDEKQLWTLRQ